MKITIVKESLCLGGTERSAANISVALAKKHDINVVLYDGRNIQYPYGGTLFDMKIPARGSKISKTKDHLRRLCYFTKYLSREKPDIVFLFTSFRHPIVKMPMRNTIKLMSSRDFSVLAKNIDRISKLLSNSDGLVCNSEYMRDYYLSKYPKDQNKVFSVKNIIDVYDIRNQGKKPIEDQDFTTFRDNHEFLIVSVGRFCAEKAFENLIAAFAQCIRKKKGIGLVLVGDGEYRNTYIQIIRKEGITDDVYFTGFQSNPYQFMCKCDLFVLSSISEGFPNVLAEAMALSLPVISINCLSGPAEILLKEPNYNLVEKTFLEADYGVLTPHYSKVETDLAINEMAKAIVYLLDDRQLRDRYSKLSFERAKQFSSEAAIDQLERIINQIKENKCKKQQNRI